jgi:hypothetical protein
MRIINLLDLLDYCIDYDAPETLYARLSAADIALHDKGLKFLDYGRWSWKRRRLIYCNKEYRIGPGIEVDTLLLSSYQKGDCCLVDSDGNRLAVDPIILSLITSTSFNKRKKYLWRENKILGNIYISLRKSFFTLADITTGKISQLEDVRAVNPCLLDECVIYFSGGDNHICCLNHDLKRLWDFRPDVNFSDRYVRGPEVYQDLVLVSYGPSRHESVPAPDYNGKQFADEKRSYDSNLYALNLKDGVLCWHVVIPKTIDNMVVLDDRLYISSTNEIHVLNPQTGNTLQVIDTGLSPEVDQYLNPSCLHIQGDKLYFCHQVDACLQVYNLDDLQLLKSINIPAPYTIKDFEYYHEATDKLYFNLKWRFPRLYYHMSPALELDPNDLDSEMELIKGPPVEIELRPSETNPDESEVWITMRNVPLDEAMVYAEMHTEDQAYYHGTHGMFDALHKTENFNGKVHFRYSGSDRPLVEVHEKMKILEERFIDWGRTIAFASTNPAEPATLDAQYQE